MHMCIDIYIRRDYTLYIETTTKRESKMRNRRISRNLTAAEATSLHTAAINHTAAMNAAGTSDQLADARVQEFKAKCTLEAITQIR